MGDAPSRLERILERCDQGAISPAIALMEMLIETEDEERVSRALRAAFATSAGARAIAALQESNAEGSARVAAMLRSGVDSPPEMASVEEGVAFCRRLFDWSVSQSEEASVALYSLGSPELLREATREIVEVLAGWGSLGRRKRALDIGCGIGRMEEALSPALRAIHGIDVSEAMISVARRRCALLRNVTLSTCSGLDLRALEEDSFDLVFAIDSFPYLVQSGLPLVRTHFAEAARVLRGGGELIVLNFAYESDPALDRRTVGRFAEEAGFDVLVDGERPFALWNGVAFRMRASKR